MNIIKVIMSDVAKKQGAKNRGWSNNTLVVFVLYTDDMGLIPSTPYGP